MRSVAGPSIAHMTMQDLDWMREVEPLPHLNGDLISILDTVRSPRVAWKRVMEADPEAFHEARKRSLRRQRSRPA